MELTKKSLNLWEMSSTAKYIDDALQLHEKSKNYSLSSNVNVDSEIL